MVCTGRRAFTESLALDKAGVSTERGVVLTDGNFRTNVENIWAIGDCVGGMMLAHNAAAQGEYVADLIAGRHNGVNLKVVPSCIYTVPEIAAVGLTEQKATEAGYEVSVGIISFGRKRQKPDCRQGKGLCQVGVRQKNSKAAGGDTLL